MFYTKSKFLTFRKDSEESIEMRKTNEPNHTYRKHNVAIFLTLMAIEPVEKC
jgi:hypothetical protein